MSSLSFRAKLRLAFVLVSLALTGAAMVAVWQAANRATHIKIENDFKKTLAALNELIDARIVTVSDASAELSANPLFFAHLDTLTTSDSALGLGDDEGGDGDDEARREVHEFFNSVDLALFRRYPIAAFLDRDGLTLFSKMNPNVYGVDLSDLPIVRGVLEGQDSPPALWTGARADLRSAGLIGEGHGDELYLVTAKAIVVDDDVLGVIVAGEPVSTLAMSVEAMTDSSIVLTDTGLTVTIGDEPFIGATKDAGTEQSVSTMDLDGVTFLVQTASLRTGGLAYLFRSYDDELAPFSDRFVPVVLAVALLAIAVSLIVGWQMARRMTEPLRALERGVRRVKGGDLDTRVEVTTTDEVGRLASAFNEMTEGLLQRDQIKATFKRYLAPAVVEELIKHPEMVNLGGEEREMTIFFSDVAGFTSLAEGRDPHYIVTLLNEYFDAVCQGIVTRGGTIDKFAGDSVMCFFNAPFDQPDHRARAILAGLDHLEAAAGLNAGLSCRIGINTGRVIVGNIGSWHGQNYTVMGDPVNLASRLEAANKFYGTKLMVSESTLRGCEDLVLSRELDQIRVKGKTQAVRVFEVMAERGRARDDQRELAAAFTEGLAHYRAREFEAAAGIFERHPDDGPSETYRLRTRFFLEHPPPDSWDAVHELLSK